MLHASSRFRSRPIVERRPLEVYQPRRREATTSRRLRAPDYRVQTVRRGLFHVLHPETHRLGATDGGKALGALWDADRATEPGKPSSHRPSVVFVASSDAMPRVASLTRVSTANSGCRVSRRQGLWPKPQTRHSCGLDVSGKSAEGRQLVRVRIYSPHRALRTRHAKNGRERMTEGESSARVIVHHKCQARVRYTSTLRVASSG